MSFLNIILLERLSFLQDALNEMITTGWQQNRTELDFMVANHQEMAELIDTSYVDSDGQKYALEWKWWKGSAKGGRTMDVIDWDNLHDGVTNNIKIELTDLLFFSLSQKILEDKTNDEEKVELNENDWLNFMAISANMLLQRPGMSVGLVIELADKLGFNIAAYYCAKHLLNYYRQIADYGNGYEKMSKGVEDNELLHNMIEGITIEDMTENFNDNYNLIAERFFKVFTAPEDKQITMEFWEKLIVDRDGTIEE